MLNVTVGDVIEGKVADFASEGEGIVKIGSYAVFVPFAIKGETVRARIRFAKKDYAFAELVEVVLPSPDRVKPRCTYFGRCGGCDLQHVTTECQLAIKKASVENALKKIGGLDVKADDVVHLNDWEYRNKIALPFAYKSKSGRVSLGFYEKKSHTVVPMKWCPLHGEWAATLIQDVSEWANNEKISVYEETTGKGLIRHVVARKLDTLTVTLVVNGSRVPKLEVLARKLEQDFGSVAIFISENTKNTNVIFGDNAKLVWGREQKQNLGAYEAVVSPLSFLQVNDEVRDAIYDKVCSFLADFDGDIIELYSGVGLLTAQIAKRLENAKITAVEIVPDATKNANALMQSLHIADRVTNVCADAVDFVSDLAKKDEQPEQSSQNIDLPDEILNSPFYLGEAPVKAKAKTQKPLALVLDPPRKGCDKRVLDTVNGADFERIAYISCNPQTLARDLKVLGDKYAIASVTPFDMFPQTSNVETLVTLKRK